MFTPEVNTFVAIAFQFGGESVLVDSITTVKPLGPSTVKLMLCPAKLNPVGATMIESDEATRISARSMLELLSAAYALHPAFGEAQIIEIGTGVRAAFPDNLPRLRHVGGSLHVNGLYRHGFLLAPALARRAAGVLLEGRNYPEVMDEDPGERRLA